VEKQFAQTDEAIVRYVNDTFAPEDGTLREIRERSAREGLPQIQLSPMDALHLEILTRAAGARKAVEIGTLGGYSGTAIARALPEGGRLFTCELEERNARVARESFERAGLGGKVAVLVGPARETLPGIEKEGPFDLVFIDADKTGYPAYLDWCASNLRVGGFVVADNTFAHGHIADTQLDDPETRRLVEAIREFNRGAAQGGRFRGTILPTGEGLTVAVRIK